MQARAQPQTKTTQAVRTRCSNPPRGLELAGQYAEKAKIAIRNVRRDANDGLKIDENKKEISEDDRKRLETEVQKMTDEMIKAVDEAAAHKEKEILSQ